MASGTDGTRSSMVHAFFTLKQPTLIFGACMQSASLVDLEAAAGRRRVHARARLLRRDGRGSRTDPRARIAPDPITFITWVHPRLQLFSTP